MHAPISPMSWYSGSHDMKVSALLTCAAWRIARTLASRLAWLSTTPLGLPVLPEVYCRKAVASASATLCTKSPAARPSSATVATDRSVAQRARSRCASGLASGTVISSRTSALHRMPAMRCRWSSSCASRAGGYSGTGTQPA